MHIQDVLNDLSLAVNATEGPVFLVEQFFFTRAYVERRQKYSILSVLNRVENQRVKLARLREDLYSVGGDGESRLPLREVRAKIVNGGIKCSSRRRASKGEPH